MKIRPDGTAGGDGKIIKINRRGEDVEVEGKKRKEGRKEKGALRCMTGREAERINTHLTRAEIDGPGLRVLQPPPSLPVGGRAIPLSLVKFPRCEDIPLAISPRSFFFFFFLDKI